MRAKSKTTLHRIYNHLGYLKEIVEVVKVKRIKGKVKLHLSTGQVVKV